MLLGNVTAERDQRLEQGCERRCARGRNLQREAREILVGAPDLEMQHFERAAAFDHRVEDRVQQLGIDQVPFGGDDRIVRLCVGHVVRIIALVLPPKGGSHTIRIARNSWLPPSGGRSGYSNVV